MLVQNHFYGLIIPQPVKPSYTKNIIKRFLDPINDIAFTTDAWSSRSDHSYITVTAHALDSDCNLHALVLNTFEMVNRHTSENLLKGIMDIINDWELSKKSDLCFR